MNLLFIQICEVVSCISNFSHAAMLGVPNPDVGMWLRACVSLRYLSWKSGSEAQDKGISKQTMIYRILTCVWSAGPRTLRFILFHPLLLFWLILAKDAERLCPLPFFRSRTQELYVASSSVRALGAAKGRADLRKVLFQGLEGCFSAKKEHQQVGPSTVTDAVNDVNPASHKMYCTIIIHSVLVCRVMRDLYHQQYHAFLQQDFPREARMGPLGYRAPCFKSTP